MVTIMAQHCKIWSHSILLSTNRHFKWAWSMTEWHCKPRKTIWGWIERGLQSVLQIRACKSKQHDRSIGFTIGASSAQRASRKNRSLVWLAWLPDQDQEQINQTFKGNQRACLELPKALLQYIYHPWLSCTLGRQKSAILHQTFQSC